MFRPVDPVAGATFDIDGLDDLMAGTSGGKEFLQQIPAGLQHRAGCCGIRKVARVPEMEMRVDDLLLRVKGRFAAQGPPVVACAHLAHADCAFLRRHAVSSRSDSFSGGAVVFPASE